MVCVRVDAGRLLELALLGRIRTTLDPECTGARARVIDPDLPSDMVILDRAHDDVTHMHSLIVLTYACTASCN